MGRCANISRTVCEHRNPARTLDGTAAGGVFYRCRRGCAAAHGRIEFAISEGIGHPRRSTCWRRCRFEPCAGFAVSRLEHDEFKPDAPHSSFSMAQSPIGMWLKSASAPTHQCAQREGGGEASLPCRVKNSALHRAGRWVLRMAVAALGQATVLHPPQGRRVAGDGRAVGALDIA